MALIDRNIVAKLERCFYVRMDVIYDFMFFFVFEIQ